MASKGNLYISDFSRKNKKFSRQKLKETNPRPIEVQLPKRAVTLRGVSVRDLRTLCKVTPLLKFCVSLGFQTEQKGGQLTCTEHLPCAQLSATSFHSSYETPTYSPHFTDEETEGHKVICLGIEVRIQNPTPTEPKLITQHLRAPEPGPRPGSPCSP